MFRVMTLGPEGHIEVTEGDARVAPPSGGTVVWIDLEAQDGPQLEALAKRFAFHPLAVEDCAHFDQRPKADEYGEYLFVVTHGLDCPNFDRIELRVAELHAFIGPDYLVTVHQQSIAALDEVWRRCAGDPTLLRRGPDFAYYLVIDAIADTNFPLLDQLADAIEELEERVLAGAQRNDLHRIFTLKRALVEMRKVLSPQRDVFGLLAKRGGAMVSEKTAPYFRDVYDHLVRVNESVETGRDLLGNALDAYLTSVSNRTNEIMKRLTIMSAIFLPLTFVTGFFGQNFHNMPYGSDALMYSMLAACVVLPALMLWWFYRSRWI